MRIIADADDVKSLAEGLGILNEWEPEEDILEYQCGSMQDGEFIPFDSPAWADDADGKAGFFDAAAAHRELHPAIKRYMEWSRRYHYDESGAGIFAALALVAHFPEEVDTAIDHIAELDLNHEVMEGEYIRRLVEHLGYNETTARLLAARATICCGQHGREDLEGYLETLDLKENAKLRTAFVEAAAAFEMRHALRMAEPFTADRERVLHFLDEGIEEWNDDPALEQAGPSELGEEIAVRARKLFEQHEFTEPLETESPAEMLGRLVGDWRAAQGEFAGGTASEQLLDAVGAAYADSSLRFPGNPTREQLQKLVDEGADVDVGDPAGRTPLWLAARHDLIAATEFLIEQGAGLSSSCDGMTPLHKAVSYGHADIACRLAEAGADIDDAVWDAALDHLKEPEQNRLAEIAAKTGMACERAKAQAAIASGGLGGEERQALTAQAVQDPAAALLLTKAEAAAGEWEKTAARLLPLFSDPGTWRSREHGELLPFLFDALRRLGRAEEGIGLWHTFRFGTRDSWGPPRLLPAVIECYAAAGRFEEGLGAISSYSYKVEKTFCDREHCLFSTVARLAEEAELAPVAHAAKTLAENHRTRTDTLQPEPELPIEQLAALHYRPEAIAVHTEFKRVSSLESVQMSFKTIPEEALVMPEADRVRAVDAMAEALEAACTGFADEVQEAGPVCVAIRMAEEPDSMPEWLQNEPTLEVGLARSIDLLESRFEFRDYRRRADIPVTGFEFVHALPLEPSADMAPAAAAMAGFAADSAVNGPLSVVLHDAVARLGGAGLFRRLWPRRWVVVAAHDPVLAVLFVGK